MSILFVLFITIIQFIVQYCLYRPIIKRLYEFHSNHLNTLSWLPAELFVINIGCTIIVCALTSAGLITGITNLFASALLGIVMSIQYKSYKNQLFNGSYYTQLQERKQREKDEKEILKQIAQERRKKLAKGHF